MTVRSSGFDGALPPHRNHAFVRDFADQLR